MLVKLPCQDCPEYRGRTCKMVALGTIKTVAKSKRLSFLFNPLWTHYNCRATNHYTAIGTVAVNGWAVTFGTARRSMGGLQLRPVPSSLYQM